MKIETKRTEKFEKIYLIYSDEISDKQMNGFIMCGDINWDYYFDRITDKYPKEKIEEIENVTLFEFNNRESAEQFLSKIDEKSVVDFSFEANFFGVLQLN